MSNIAYYRVSTLDQSIEAQRSTLHKSLGISFDKEFIDEGVSGAIAALDRKGFKELMGYIREGDSLFVYSVDSVENHLKLTQSFHLKLTHPVTA